MKRDDVAHIVRAAKAITNEREFVLIGSQAAHLQVADMPDVMQMSGELDIYPLRKPELSDLIDGAMGEGSPFHESFGYYAHGIGPETAKLPRGWQDRSIRISAPSMQGAIAIAPEIHDICASKAVAGRPKDYDYIDAAIQTKIVKPERLLKRIALIDTVPSGVRSAASSWVKSKVAKQGRDR